MRGVWIVGPIAWDSVYYLQELPQPGKFAQSLRNVERPGGTAANSAIAIASTGIETGFAGYVGDDELSSKLMDRLQQSKIAHLHMQHLSGKSSHVAIYIDAKGERTIIGLSEDRLEVVTLTGADLKPDDIVVFHLWRDHFEKDLARAKQAGCTTVVGIEALKSDISADIAIGSHEDIDGNIELTSQLSRFSRIVVTEGANGASEYSQVGREFCAALEVKAVDATGAGDAFLAGYITAVASEIDDAQSRLKYGTTWASLAVQSESSIPPEWSDVKALLSR
jgi:sugar/nucleoside kinase (ribokinase family)